MVLIPKGNREFRGIGIVEVLWNVLLGVIDQQVEVAVQFHDVIHGFWAGRVTGTASLKAKLIQQMSEIREEVL